MPAATMRQAPPRPEAGTRIESLDVLRGVAVCGILLMNIGSKGGVTEYPLTTYPARWNAEWVTWGVQTVFVQGAMRGLFTLLFGAGMLLMLRRAEGVEGRAAPIDAWARRALALMALGTLMWSVLLWPGEILWNYGVSGLFLLAFRAARTRTLLVAAALLLTALTANTAYWTREQVVQLRQGEAMAAQAKPATALNSDQRAALAAAARYDATIHPSAAARAAAIDQRRHLRSLFRWSAAYWSDEHLSLTGWLDIVESVAFMLLGMALFRGGVLTGTGDRAIYVRLIVCGYGAGIAWRIVPVVLAARTGWDMGSSSVAPWQWIAAIAMFEPARLMMTLGHLGAIVLLFQTRWLGRAVALQALGRMALTVYCLQALIGSVLFYGLGLVGQLSLPALWLVAVAIWIVTGAFCRWWLDRFAMGPIERLLRAVSYPPRSYFKRPDGDVVAPQPLRRWNDVTPPRTRP